MGGLLPKKIKSLLLIFIFIGAIGAVGGILFKYHIFVFRYAASKAVKEMPVLEKYRIEIVKWFTFSEENALKEWEEKVFKGRVVYMIEKDKDVSYVHAKSDKTASALYYKIKLDAKNNIPIVKWRWMVTIFPNKELPESLETKNEDDFAARVYVIFPAKFITNCKVIEYVWTETLPAGTTGISPYSKNIRLMALRSGPGKEGMWYLEERDIAQDYIQLFGEKPRMDVGAVAFMTDADTTKTSAASLYTDIKLGYKEGVR